MTRISAIERLLLEEGPLLTRSGTAADPSTLHRAVTAGVLVSPLPGVYLAATVAGDPTLRLAAVAAWNPDAVVLGAAAARATFWPELRAPRIEVASATRIHRPGYSFSNVVVPPELVRRRPGLTVLAPAAAAVDLAGQLGPDVIDTALRSRRITLDQLWDALRSMPNRPGNRGRRRIMIESRTNPWSAAERLAHREFRTRGLTGWVANAPVVTSNGELYYLDLRFRGVNLAVEIDGRIHQLDRKVFEQDRVRQNDLVRDGWIVLRFTYRQLCDDPQGVVDLVRQVLARARRSPRPHRMDVS